MDSKLTMEEQLSVLEPGKSLALGDPTQPGQVLTQVSRVGDLYYVTGPYFETYAPGVDLGELFAIGRANGDDHAQVMRLLNQYLSDHGVPAAAQLHRCQGLAEAHQTLSALLATYMLSQKLD